VETEIDELRAEIAGLKAEVDELTEKNDQGWALAAERLKEIERLKSSGKGS
jgi:hypothetical protein